jgi:GNAT superfamily N-acetyltransferase
MRPAAVLPKRPGNGFTSPRLRAATSADAPKLAALWAKARPEAGVDQATLKKWLATGRALLLEDAAGRALAALRYHEEEGGWRVEPIVTDPNQRGQGFGRWLMTTLEADAIKGNVPFLALEVREPTTLPYYLRLGYRPTGDDELQLRKRVGGVWQQQGND